MKRVGIVVLVGQLLAGIVLAQHPGMPVGSTVKAGEAGTWQVGAVGGVASEGTRFVGARGAYAFSPTFKLFADVGRLSGLEESATVVVAGDADSYDQTLAATAIQLGALWALPFELPGGLDFGARLALMKPLVKGESWSASDAGPGYNVYVDVDMDVDIIGGSLSAMVSRDMKDVLPGLSAYGFVGLHVVRTKVEWTWTTGGRIDLGFGFGGVSGSYTESDSETVTDTDPGIGVGAIYQVGRVSFFAELAHVGGAMGAAGAMVSF